MNSGAEASSSTSTSRPTKVRPDPIPKTKPSSTLEDPFASLPSAFDADRFQPPAWAKDMPHLSERHADNKMDKAEGEDDNESLGLSEQDTLWEDAREEFDEGVDEVSGEFTLAELKRLLEKGTELKGVGNSHFTARPQRLDEAVEAYQAALACLPIPRPKSRPETATNDSQPSEESSSTPNTAQPTAPSPPPGESGIQELTEAEAAALEAELNRSIAQTNDTEESIPQPKSEEEQREEIYEAIGELRKVCYGNLGAAWLAQVGKEKECVEVCTEALKTDPRYTKALQRRATANERIGTWTSLTSAQEDYTTLLTLLPSNALSPIRKSLSALPGRMQEQQQIEKDEMMSKLKDLGNGLLGKFGLSTDMFKFDPQEGGGYSMRFER